MAELNPQPLPPKDNRIRIHVNSDVDYDIDKLTRITGAVLEKLGCPSCHSGWTLDFVRMHDFVVNPKTLEVNEVALNREQGF